jgi:serine/threonine protein kinase
MPKYIELYGEGTHLGQFDLPAFVVSDTGQRIRLVSVVQGGGNGIVVRAQLPSGKVCAVKLLRQRDASRVDRFANEARILKVLNHPNITRFYGRGDLELAPNVEIPWIAMELGRTNLKRHVQSQGPLLVPILRTVGTQLCNALTHLHQVGFIHRDLKPDNLVWDYDVPHNVQVIDFGIAKGHGEDVSARALDQFTAQSEFVGPVFYSSPELVAYATDKTHRVDQRSDLFQLGKVLWFLGTGRIAMGIPSKTQCPASGRLWDIVMGLIQEDPASRPTHASDVCLALESLC